MPKTLYKIHVYAYVYMYVHACICIYTSYMYCTVQSGLSSNVTVTTIVWVYSVRQFTIRLVSCSLSVLKVIAISSAALSRKW